MRTVLRASLLLVALAAFTPAAAAAATWHARLVSHFQGIEDRIGATGFDVNARGVAAAVWFEGDSDHVMVSIRDRARTRFGKPVDLGRYDYLLNFRPMVAVDHAGGTTVIWVDGVGSEPDQLMKAYRPPHGVFGAPAALSDPARPASQLKNPRIGVTRRGAVVVAWDRDTEHAPAGSDIWVRDPSGRERRDSVPSDARLVRGGEEIAWSVGDRCKSHARAARLSGREDPYGRPHHFPFAFDQSVTSRGGQMLAAEYDESCHKTRGGIAAILRAFVLSPTGHAVGGEIYRHNFDAGQMAVADDGSALFTFTDLEGRLLLRSRLAHRRFAPARRLTGRCPVISGGYGMAMDRRANAVLLGVSEVRGHRRLVTAVKPRGSGVFRTPLVVGGKLLGRRNYVFSNPLIRFDRRDRATALWHIYGKGMVVATSRARALRTVARRSRRARCPGSRRR
jgi:hypothetical protein